MNTSAKQTTHTSPSHTVRQPVLSVGSPTYPRARNTDPDTSHKAARFATSQKAASERLSIYLAVCVGGPMTAREIAHTSNLDYIEVQRRISEVLGLKKTEAVRDGCRVWDLVGGAE